MDSTHDLLKRLTASAVDFVIVGGMAAYLHGSTLVTDDLDICAPFTEENLARLLKALAGLNPRHRMTPQRLPLPSEAGALRGFRNLYLETDAGQLDVLDEIAGVGDFAAVAEHAVTVQLFGMASQVLDLNALIRAKAAIGRPKDLRAVAELETIRRLLEKRQRPDG